MSLPWGEHFWRGYGGDNLCLLQRMGGGAKLEWLLCNALNPLHPRTQTTYNSNRTADGWNMNLLFSRQPLYFPCIFPVFPMYFSCISFLEMEPYWFEGDDCWQQPAGGCFYTDQPFTFCHIPQHRTSLERAQNLHFRCASFSCSHFVCDWPIVSAWLICSS